MKKILSLIALLLISFAGFSQTKGINYQAVIIDPNPIQIPGSDITAQPYVSKEVWIRFGIYAGTTLQYEELHKTNTDEFGLVNLIIGAGVNTGKAGTFTSLNWDGVTKNIITNVSFDQGGRYTEVSNQKFTYVPYTLLAETAVKLAGVLPIASGGTGATNAIAARTNLGLGNVDNTADVDKPVSIATLAILDTKESITNKSINIIADSASSVKYPSVKAIKDYIDSKNAVLAQQALQANRANLAAKATALETPRTINGIAFDGTANITIPIPDADATTKGLVQLAGDLTGTASAPAIAVSAVTTSKVADGAISDAKITSVSGSKVTGNIAGNATNVTGMIAVANGGTGATTATGALTNLGAEAVANKSTDLTADASSIVKYPSVKLIKDYVDTRVAAAGVSDGSITSAKITDGTIVSADIAANAGITNAQLANSSLTVGSTNIALGATTSSLAGLSTVTATNFTGALMGNAATATLATSATLAATATKLAATKNINGVAFDGSSDITVPADATTLSGIVPISKGGTGSSTQNFVDLTTGQTIAGQKIFSEDSYFNGLRIGKGASNNIQNTAVGYTALGSNTTGEGNTAIGFQGQMSGTTGSSNTSLGFAALIDNTTSSGNTAIGYQALQKNTGDNNIAIGTNTMYLAQNSTRNIVVGSNALETSANGAAYNIIMGVNSMRVATSAAENVTIGNEAGSTFTNETRNTLLGASTDIAAGITNSAAIGYGAVVNASNKIQLGNANVTAVNTSGTMTAAGFSGPLTGNASTATLADNISATANTSLTSLANLATVGTITSGTWSASTIDVAHGGTGATSLTGILKGNGTGAFSAAVAGVDFETAIAASTQTPTAKYWRGDKTWQTLNTDVVPELTNNQYFTKSRVLGTELANLLPAHGVISTTDNVTAAFNKTIGNQLMNTSTGVFTFTGISLASSTTFNVGAAEGYIVDNTTDIEHPTMKYLEYAGATGVSTPYLASHTMTYVYLDNTGTLQLSGTELTPAQRRQNILLGKLGHPDHTSIISTYTQPDVLQSPLSQLRDVWQPIRLVNDGFTAIANGSNLNFNTTAGTLFGLGIGYGTNPNSPSSLAIAAKTPVTFQYRTQLGGVNTDVTLIDPTKYDNAGTLTTVAGTGAHATNQRIFLLQNGKIRVQYGQTDYTTLANAIAGIQSESFSTYAGIKDYGILIGILTVRKDATNLSDPAKAQFFNVTKFGETIGATSGVVTSDLQQSYNNGAQIITNSTSGAFDIRRGTAADSDNVVVLQNGAGTPVLTINGAGTITSGTWSGTAIAIANGGTGATTATDALTNLGAEAVANRSTDITMGGLGATDSKYPTQLAVKTYVSNQFASGGVADGSITNAKLYGGIDASKLIGTDIATVGTITTGTWSGSTIAIAKGGTGATTAAAALTNLGAEATANKSDNTSLGSSTSLFPTQNAVKTYVDTKVAAATIADADVNTKGKIQLAGDLGNTAASPSVLTVGGSSASNIHAAELVANAATDANTVSTIVKRNSAGDFSAGTITASIVGNVTGNASGTAANVTGIVVGANGGTGINNGSKTMTIGGDFVTSGTGALSLTYSGTTNVTLPSTGTLATITGSENLSNKTINGLSLNSLSTGFSISGGTISKTLTIADNATLSGTNTGDQTITLTGDVTGSGTGSFATSLANSGVTAGQYGSATTAPNITVDAKGRITSVTNTTITGVSPIGSSLTNGNIFMGSGGVVTAVPITGDFTINSSGVGTISATSVTNNMLAGGIDLTTKVSGALPVANGGTGATSLTGYVKGNGTSAFTSSTSIPVADITGAVVKVNGVQPDGTGNVTVPTVAVITGTLTSFTNSYAGSYTGTSGTTFVVSQDNASNNGRTFIFDGTNTWHEITTNQAATDSRYLIKSGDSMTGALTVPSMTITNAPASSTDATTKAYVDNLVANATPSATSSILGKIQLAGDLGGSATLPTIVTVGGAAANDIASATSLANAATYSNTANSIVRRDVSGNFSAGTITASLVGNVTGNVSGTAANVTGVVAVANGGSGASTLTGYIKGNGTSAYTASATIPVADVTNAENNSNKSSATDLGGVSANNTKYPTQLAVKSYVDSQVAAATIADADASTKGKIQLTGDLGNTAASPTVVSVGGSTASNINAATILANAATATNTASAIVRRDASGNFNAGTITANLTGTASKATILATGRTIATTGDVSYTSGSFDGSANVTGIATLANSGVVSGTYGSSTAIPSLTIDSKGRITSATTTSIIAGVNTVGAISGVSDPAGATISGTTISLTPADATNGGVVTTGTQTFAGAKTFNSTITGSVSGNAGTATKLQTARTIGITGDLTYTSPSFDGSGNVTAAATLANSGVVSGTYGSSTAIPSLTIDSKGRITSATTTSIIAGVNTVASIAGTSNANGATISGTTITLTPADGTNGGVITSGAQTLAGVKTFSNNTAATSTSSGAVIVTGGLGVGGAIYGGSIQNTPIGSTTASAGAFTTLSASGATTLTSLTASGTATLTSLTTTGAATFSSTVTIPTGAGLNKVLTSDANGGATWNANPNSAFKLVSTATYTVSATDDKYVIYTNAATGTISLPAITSTMSGKEIIIKNISNFNVTISANGSQKIVADFANNTATSATLGVEASNNWVRLIADGTNSQWILFRALF